MKILLKSISFTIIVVSSLFCDTVSFKEGKYVEALDIFTYRDGNVSYTDTQTTIHYKDGKTIIKIDDNLTVQNDSGKILTTIDLGKRVDISLYFKFTKALFSKDFKSLEENFEIKEQKENSYLFMPKDETKKVIKDISLLLNGDKNPKEFTINFENGDIIKIETK